MIGSSGPRSPTTCCEDSSLEQVSASGRGLTSVGWRGMPGDLALGAVMARILFGLGVAYAGVVVAGFISRGNVSQPLADPYLGIAEGLILVMAPVMVTLVAAVHASAPARARTSTLVALGWMVTGATLTMTVHFVELTVGRRVSGGAVPGYSHLFSFTWPSVAYAVDILAWDGLIGLSLMFAATAFTHDRNHLVRRGLLIAGTCCLLGLIGPVVGSLAWRAVGIFGYAIVLPLTCLPLSRAFQQRELHRANAVY